VPHNPKLLAEKPVLVHCCFNPEIGQGLPMAGCTCKQRITFKARDAKIGAGMAQFIVLPNSNGRPWSDTRQIVMLRKQTKVPRAPTIEKAHIERAFVCGGGDPAPAIAERERIEAYGALNELNWIGLGAESRCRGQISPSVAAGDKAPPLSAACTTYWMDQRSNPSMRTGKQRTPDEYVEMLVDLHRLGDELPKVARAGNKEPASTEWIANLCRLDAENQIGATEKAEIKRLWNLLCNTGKGDGAVAAVPA
jgi:hypothetical protein